MSRRVVWSYFYCTFRQMKMWHSLWRFSRQDLRNGLGSRKTWFPSHQVSCTWSLTEQQTNFISTFTELHVHGDERWPLVVTSNTYFRGRGPYMVGILATGIHTGHMIGLTVPHHTLSTQKPLPNTFLLSSHGESFSVFSSCSSKSILNTADKHWKRN